jgi:hypothetical protein
LKSATSDLKFLLKSAQKALDPSALRVSAQWSRGELNLSQTFIFPHRMKSVMKVVIPVFFRKLFLRPADSVLIVYMKCPGLQHLGEGLTEFSNLLSVILRSFCS